MYALLREMPDFTTSWWRYMLAMMRASNREVGELNDNMFIAAHIAMTAARDNPMSMLETFEIMEHGVGLARKGAAGMQDKMADYAFDQIEEGTRAYLNTILKADGEKLGAYMRREAEIMEAVSNFNEQIEAIQTMAISPVRFLVVPKFLALLVMLPCLTVIGDVAGIMGGYVIGVYSLNINPALYMQTSFDFLTLKDIYTGLTKPFVFAVIISMVGAYQGLRTRGGAVGVGQATTVSVVTSFILIILADAVVTGIFYFSEI